MKFVISSPHTKRGKDIVKMKFAGRMNSFIHAGAKDVFEAIAVFRSMPEITHLEFNYPEHIALYDMEKLVAAAGDMPVNGVATRFKDRFVAGEFTNSDTAIAQEAVELCTNAVDACKALGGEYLTVWLGFDGFDYPFQLDYESKWNKMIRSFQIVADYAMEQGIKISIEYKPFEPRAYSLLDGIGLTLLAIDEIDRPNVGVTLDFCHMLMRHESPAFSLALAARRGKLFGLHMNDGYRMMDNGLIFGSVNFPQALEFVYYLKKYHYDGVVFFDSFPFRENARHEIETNVAMFNKMSGMIDAVGMDRIASIVSKQDGVECQRLWLQMLK